MSSSMLLPVVCLVLRGGDGWSESQASFRRELQPGHAGYLVYTERLDASTLRIRVLAEGTRLVQLDGDFPGSPSHAFRARVSRGSAQLRLVTVAPEGPGILRLKVQGEDFSPEVLVMVPKAGEPEGLVLQAELGPAGGIRSK